MRKGTTHSEDSKLRIRNAKLGKTFTEEHALAISNALKGRKKSAAHKLAISEGIRAARANRLLNSVAQPVEAQVEKAS